MYNPVIPNEYEIDLHIIKQMLPKGLVSREEFNKIDAENDGLPNWGAVMKGVWKLN